jgi:hypothetical protein
VVTVLEDPNLKASPSVCHKRRLMLWARKVVPALLLESVVKIPMQIAGARLSMSAPKENQKENQNENI